MRRCCFESRLTLFLQDESCRDADGNLALPFGSLCSKCLHLANSKQLMMCACRFSLLLDMIDLLDVRLHDPEASFRQFTDTAQTADYAGVPLLKEELDNLTCLSVHELVLALETKIASPRFSFRAQC